MKTIVHWLCEHGGSLHVGDHRYGEGFVAAVLPDGAHWDWTSLMIDGGGGAPSAFAAAVRSGAPIPAVVGHDSVAAALLALEDKMAALVRDEAVDLQYDIMFCLRDHGELWDFATECPRYAGAAWLEQMKRDYGW